ncbi:MAG TPA: SGNH/GDSL hydrolase family protein [Methylibium sp.]|uniref:SGNH/GDSL hydrolase family protein n=1 Tax=Methylibium sp. TaxID=2067992 RepID=UPI002DBFABF3|nr:SGNH/GDSL hydrolase family protein [Methylibium sp.]HEU4460631.1 SGNH/GDSL hydrolase family protein [Methylibium sp.]
MTPPFLPRCFAALGLTLALACAAAASRAAERPIRVMPLGDSITEACCWRDLLYAGLRQLGLDVDFVGSRGGPLSPPGKDWNHEGHGGYRVTDLLKPAGTGEPSRRGLAGDRRDLQAWFGPQNDAPDIVLMHFGTNDRWGGIAPARILEAYGAVLAAARERNPQVTLLVAQIVPMANGVDVRALNEAIPRWAREHDTPRSRVIVVDHASGFDSRWTLDGVHPNPTTGSQWMADRWFAALRPLLD